MGRAAQSGAILSTKCHEMKSLLGKYAGFSGVMCLDTIAPPSPGYNQKRMPEPLSKRRSPARAKSTVMPADFPGNAPEKPRNWVKK